MPRSSLAAPGRAPARAPALPLATLAASSISPATAGVRAAAARTVLGLGVAPSRAGAWVLAVAGAMRSVLCPIVEMALSTPGQHLQLVDVLWRVMLSNCVLFARALRYVTGRTMPSRLAMHTCRWSNNAHGKEEGGGPNGWPEEQGHAMGRHHQEFGNDNHPGEHEMFNNEMFTESGRSFARLLKLPSAEQS